MLGDILTIVSAPKAKALGFLLQRPNLRQHVHHWHRGSCLRRREFPQAPLRYCTSTTCISTWVHRSSRQQYYTPRWHLCRRRIHNRDKHALGSTSLSVPRYHSCYIFVRLATYVKSAIHDRNLSLRGLQTILHRRDHASTPPWSVYFQLLQFVLRTGLSSQS